MVLLAFGPSLRAEEHFETLTVGVDTFTNVTVTSKTGTDVFFRHARGFSNVKIKDLATETAKQLGLEVAPPPAPPPPEGVLSKLEVPPEMREMQEKMAGELAGGMQRLGRQGIIGVGLLLGVLYLFHCYCCMLICQKTGNAPGPLVWVPVLQLFPLLRAAGMPAWWFVLSLVPLVNLVVAVMWCFKIAHARGKSALTGLCLLLPVTNVFAFLYLAFSRAGEEVEAATSMPEKVTFN